MPESKQTEHISDEVSDIIKKAAEYKMQILYVCIGLIAVAALYGVISSTQKKAEDKAWSEMFKATFAASSGKGSLPDELAEALKKCSGAKARFYAYIVEEGELATGVEKENLEKAAKAAEKFLKDFPGHPFAEQVRLDYASILVNLGKHEEASKNYSIVAQKGPEYLVNEAKLFNALTYEALGKDNEALDAYAKLAARAVENTRDPVIDYAAFARVRLLNKQRSKSTTEATPAASIKKPAKTPEATGKTTEKKPAAEKTPVTKEK